MIFIKWHLIQSKFIEQISFQLPNTLLLATIPHKKRRYGRTEYNQSWFENIWVQCYEVLIYEILQKEFKMEPQTFEYLLNMIRPGIEKNGVFQLGLPVVQQKYFKFLNLFFIYITVLG